MKIQELQQPGWWGWGRPGGWKARQQRSGFLNLSCRSRRRPGAQHPVCTDGQPFSPPGHLCGVSVGTRSTPMSWAPCWPAQKALKPSQKGLVWRKLSSRCPPLLQAISLPWLPALLNTRPGFPSSVKASGFSSPPGASCSPGPRPGPRAGSRSRPSS